MTTYLWNEYVEIIQILYYSDHTILSYKESARFTGTTLVYSLQKDTVSYWLNSVRKVVTECCQPFCEDLIEAQNRVWYSNLKTTNPVIFVNFVVQNKKQQQSPNTNIYQEFLQAFL